MNLAYSNDKYCVVVPYKVEQIIAEGIALQHNVDTHIEGILAGEWQIVFLRKKDEVDKPLVTLRVRNNKVDISSGHSNRLMTFEESRFVDEYNEYLADPCGVSTFGYMYKRA